MFDLKKNEEIIALDPSGIDTISESIARKLGKYGIGRKDILKLRLDIEDQLMKISEHYGSELSVTLRMGKRLGTPYVYISYEGDSFDPSSQKDELDGLFHYQSVSPQWYYRHKLNILYYKAPYQTPRSEVYLILAVAAAFLTGLLRMVIPPDVLKMIIDYGLTPVSDAFLNVLGAFVRFMIFFSVITGICSIESLSDFSKMGKLITKRMLLRSFIGTGMCLLITFPLYQFGQGELKEGTSQLSKIIDLVFSAFPKDLITPFVEGNTLQIIFLAVIIGVVLLITGEKTAAVRRLTMEFSSLFTDVIRIICKLLPIYIFVSLLSLIWQNGSDLIIKLWKPIAICLLVCCLFLLIKTIYVCARFRLAPIRYISAIKGTVLLGLVTASTSATFNDVMITNEKKLGISPKFNRIGIPFANLLVCSVFGSSLALTVYYMAEYYAVPVSIEWFITAWVMCTVLSIASPPVSGGMLVVTGMLMLQLNIPQDGLAIAGLLGIVTDFICTGTTIGITHGELLIEADMLNMLDREKLASLKKK